MTTNTEEVLKEALALPAIERANLVDRLLSSLDQPDKTIDEIWRKEIEARIAAYEEGKAETVSVKEVLAKYKKR
jgi:putative addiction module component (TIGR02574 family)